MSNNYFQCSLLEVQVPNVGEPNPTIPIFINRGLQCDEIKKKTKTAFRGLFKPIIKFTGDILEPWIPYNETKIYNDKEVKNAKN